MALASVDGCWCDFCVPAGLGDLVGFCLSEVRDIVVHCGVVEAVEARYVFGDRVVRAILK